MLPGVVIRCIEILLFIKYEWYKVADLTMGDVVAYRLAV